MFGNNEFSAFPTLKEKTESKKIEFTSRMKLVLISVSLLFPATWFWASVILRLGLGTDYFFDIFFQKLGQTFLGNTVLIVAVIFMPGITIGISGINYMQKKDKVAIGIIVFAALLIAAGFFAAVRRA